MPALVLALPLACSAPASYGRSDAGRSTDGPRTPDRRLQAHAAARRHEYTQVHMGLPVRLVFHAAGDADARRAAEAAFARIARLDAVMSDYRADSELNQLGTNWKRVSPELFAVLARAVEISRDTDGAFDPTVGPLVALWRETRRSQRAPDSARLAEARSRVGWRQLKLDATRQAVRLGRPGMRVDLGGIAKGWILQDAARILREHHLTSTLVESGGDIVVGDPPPGQRGWRIETPGADASFAERASRLTNATLATSGPTAQFVEIEGIRYSHVVDPRTGLGLTNHVAANVIAHDGATADALATALTVAGPERGREILARFPGVVADVRTR